MFQTSNSIRKACGEGPVWVGPKPIPGVGLMIIVKIKSGFLKIKSGVGLPDPPAAG